MIFNELPGRRVDFNPDPDALGHFAGNYISNELDAEYLLFLKDSTLMYKISFQQALPITQASNNVFVSDGPSFLFFTRQ